MTHDVGIVGLSGYESDPARLAQAVSYFESRGCAVRVAPQPGRSVGRFAATDAERLEALYAIADDPALDIVIAMRGGYGLTRLLPSIDYARLAASIRGNRQKWVGQSDFTALQLALLARCGVASLGGPMAGPDFGAPVVDAFTESQFWQAVDGTAVETRWPCDLAPLALEGLLWGGNLAMLCSLIGTPYLPPIDGGILFVEDISEQPYRIERMLLQLDMAGILSRQRAVVLGDFTGMRDHPYDRDFTLDSAIAFIRARAGIPVITGLPFGHGAVKTTLAVGASCELRLDGQQALLRWQGTTA